MKFLQRNNTQGLNAYQVVTRQRQSRLILGMSTISILAASVYLIHNLRQSEWVGAIITSCIILVYAVVAGLVYLNRVEAASKFLIYTGGMGLFFSAYADKVGNSGLFFIYTYPIYMTFLAGKRLGLILSAIFSFALVLAYLLHATGLAPMSFSNLAFIYFAISYVLIYLVIYFYIEGVDSGEKNYEKHDQEISAAHERIQAIISSIGEAVFVIDASQQIKEVNQAAEQLLARESQNIIGSNITEILQLSQITDQGSSPYSLFSPELQTKTIRTNIKDNLYLTVADTRQLSVQITASPLSYAGRATGTVIVVKDTSIDKARNDFILHEVARRTQQIEEGRSRLLASATSMSAGYIVTDKELQITLANKAALQLLAAIGIHTSLQQILSEIDRLTKGSFDLTTTLRHCLITGQPFVLETLDLSTKIVRLTITPIATEGIVEGTVILIHDITERQLVERSKDEFLSIASHEFQTPLSIIRMNASLIKADDQTTGNLAQKLSEQVVVLIAKMKQFLLDASAEQQNEQAGTGGAHGQR